MVEKKTIELVDKDMLSNDIGDKNQLETNDKSNLVNAINEIKNNSSSAAKDVTLEDLNDKFIATNVEDALMENKESIQEVKIDIVNIQNELTGQKQRFIASVNRLNNLL